MLGKDGSVTISLRNFVGEGLKSKWLLFNTNSAIFQLYHGENKLTFKEMMMRSTLYWTNTLSWIFSASSLKQQSVDRHVTPLGHITSWFWANQSLLFLLNVACLEEKQQIPISVFGLTRLGLDPTIYCTRGEHANHYITD